VDLIEQQPIEHRKPFVNIRQRVVLIAIDCCDDPVMIDALPDVIRDE